MDWEQWQPIYEEILADFGWIEAGDLAAAQHLHHALGGASNWRAVGTELKHRSVVVVGCGPQLAELSAERIPAGIVVAADGATTRLRELGIVPRVVVTDLDGDPDALRWAANQGASMVIHAHADNIERLDEVANLGPFVAGTVQCNPSGLEPLRNMGGFTDGDRAVLLCEEYQAKQIHLVAFDTAAAPSDYSHGWDPELKPRKLAWCRRILDEAARRLPLVGNY